MVKKKKVTGLVAGICNPNHIKHMTILLKSLQYCALYNFCSIVIVGSWDHAPAFYYIRIYTARLRQTWATKCCA